MAGKGGRRGSDVTLSKTARASLGDKGAAATTEWSRHFCGVCNDPIRIKDMIVIRELSSRGDAMVHYHATCSGLPRS